MNQRFSGCALILFGFLVLFASRAWGECTPVVYAFRHAEDTNPPNPPGPIFALTPTGQAHGALYPAMISDFEAARNYCAVAKVYATTKVDKVAPCDPDCKSATNAFDTAKRLASEAMGGADPITTVGTRQLYEFLGNGNAVPANPSYSTGTATALRTELLATANLGKSSAVFWTSEGLHVLGGAIINRNSHVPIKNGSAIPPRNAVYVFEADGGAPSIAGFKDTPLSSISTHPVPSSVYVQCFNWTGPTTQPIEGRIDFGFIEPTGSPLTQKYYCGYNDDQSNLGGKPPKGCAVDAACGTIPNDRNKDIKGKICDTTTVTPLKEPGTSIFGACE